MTPVCNVAIPIYNALHVARPCFESALRWTDLSVNRIVLINDGSDAHTTEVLRTWATSNEGVVLLENERNQGFVRACNRVLAESSSEFVVLLNSDTCVTPRWLEKMTSCFRSDERIAIASPLTNHAPHLQIPMAPGMDYVSMNALVEALSLKSYPDVTTPEGFCYMIRVSALKRLGLFDLVFDDGYGEESDLAMRANYFGYRTVCVDDTYIYHRGRGTFGDDVRQQLVKKHSRIFHDRWSGRYPRQFEDFVDADPIGYLRDAIERAGAGLVRVLP